jgi:hypothetical protein
MLAWMNSPTSAGRSSRRFGIHSTARSRSMLASSARSERCIPRQRRSARSASPLNTRNSRSSRSHAASRGHAVNSASCATSATIRSVPV